MGNTLGPSSISTEMINIHLVTYDEVCELAFLGIVLREFLGLIMILISGFTFSTIA
jgi:hypothetical protein